MKSKLKIAAEREFQFVGNGALAVPFGKKMICGLSGTPAPTAERAERNHVTLVNSLTLYVAASLLSLVLTFDEKQTKICR